MHPRRAPTRPRHPSLARPIAAGIAVLGLLALLIFGLIQKAPDTTIGDSLAEGKLPDPPGFGLEVLDSGQPGRALARTLGRALADGQVALEELRGAPLVLNFWASWCAPCRQEADVLQRGWQVARKQGVLFLGVNMQDARSDARGFLREFEIDYPSVRESERETAEAYGATGLPETFFITADGRIAGRHIGPIEAAELKEGIDAARTRSPLGSQADPPTPGFRLVPVKPDRQSPSDPTSSR